MRPSRALQEAGIADSEGAGRFAGRVMLDNVAASLV